MLAQDLQQSFPHTATAQQLTLFDKLAHFINQPNKNNCFVLRGYAGTGKTTCVSLLVKLLPKYKISTVLLAPTGRAAKVIGNYSGRAAFTIHRKIYQKTAVASADINFSLAPNYSKDTIYIVDEASMLANEANEWGGGLLHDLFRYVYNGKNNRIIFVGDTAQLPPIGTNESPALSPTYLENNYHLTVYHTELTEVVRQQQLSGILENATTIRQQISTQVVAFPQLKTRNFKDVFSITGEKIIDGLSYAYRKYGEENSLVICRSNKNANLYNQHIRNQVLGREDELTGGDWVMIVKNNYFWMPEERGSFIANGETAKITRVRNVREMYGFRFADVSLTFEDAGVAFSIDCKVMLDTLYAETPALNYEDQKRFFTTVMQDYAHLKTKRECMEELKQNPYFNALQIKFAYAVTCHKAQGGQWDIVFIDQGYLTDEMLNTELLRWLYTATTRAAQQLFYVNFSDSFFGKM
ncbi:MAG: ATP-dependent endonuclease [Sphingobacteriales bacterium]|nr:MAG: ATP-dependent endonuclease [Sphingobacteriales bacterium]TAF81352.1 MAG: ATP-dependent endonuclease [Sphingobacteriales bacterium]